MRDGDGQEIAMKGAKISRRPQPARKWAAASRPWRWRHGNGAWSIWKGVVGALLVAIRWLSDVIVAAIADMKELLRTAKRASDLELAKMREMNEAAWLVIQRAHVALDDNVAMRETVIGRIVEHAGPKVIAELQPWLVVRETALSRKRAWRLA
jgi:hypothetical protein